MKKPPGRTQLQVAASRLQHVEAKQWAGYLTPSQTLALHDAGAQLEPSVLARAQADRASGQSHALWTYFRLTNALREQLISGVRRAS